MERRLVVVVGCLLVLALSLSAVLAINENEEQVEDEWYHEIFFITFQIFLPAQFKTRTTRDVMSDVSFTRDPRLTSVGRNKKKNQRQQSSSVDQYCMTKVGRRTAVCFQYLSHYMDITITHTLSAGLRDGRGGAACQPGRERGPLRQFLPVRLRGLHREQEHPG